VKGSCDTLGSPPSIRIAIVFQRLNDDKRSRPGLLACIAVNRNDGHRPCMRVAIRRAFVPQTTRGSCGQGQTHDELVSNESTVAVDSSVSKRYRLLARDRGWLPSRNASHRRARLRRGWLNCTADHQDARNSPSRQSCQRRARAAAETAGEERATRWKQERPHENGHLAISRATEPNHVDGRDSPRRVSKCSCPRQADTYVLRFVVQWDNSFSDSRGSANFPRGYLF
jgi:hypothetical protein